MSEMDYIEFEWDSGNYSKSRIKHDISPEESEQIFGNIPLIILDDNKHSGLETRYIAIGKTNTGKKLFVSFTYRGTKIRIISARLMNQKERIFYEKEKA